ncbi:signal peptidase I [Helicobacter sp. 13S00401-1]|nr:signal peptidase I [Helicobacter sp. 13S00401-1]PAF49033.1 signal peptidase I [Helicobacter sp. 13S00401-1]
MKVIKSAKIFASSWIGTIIIVLLFIFFIAQGFVIPSRSMVGTYYEGDMLFVKKFSYGVSIPMLPWINRKILPDFNHNGHLISGPRPKRGDVVVFFPPGLDHVHYIKRTFATGGDQVVFAPDGMYLRPNGGDKTIEAEFANYPTKEFFGEKYVYEPYSKEHHGIHYGGDWPILASFDALKQRYEISKYDPSAKIGMEMRESKYGEVFYAKIPKDSFFMMGDNRDNSEDSRFWGTIDYSRVVGKPWFIAFSITLSNSREADVSNPKNKFKIRWSRMFRSIHSLESSIPEYGKNAEVITNNTAISPMKLHSLIKLVPLGSGSNGSNLAPVGGVLKEQ